MAIEWNCVRGIQRFKAIFSLRTGRLRRSYAGRVDFYYEINFHEFKGETKFCWLSNRKNIDTVNNYLDKAKRDIRKSYPDGQRRLAVVVVTLYISIRQKKNLKESIETRVNQITELDGDAFAWVFPNIEKCISYNRQRLFPGTIMIIKEVKR